MTVCCIHCHHTGVTNAFRAANDCSNEAKIDAELRLFRVSGVTYS